MRRVLNVVLGCAILLISTALVLAHGNAHATEKISVNGAEISVDYNRPSLNGRSVEQLLAQLGPGGIWRLGADQATAFVTTADLSFMNGGQGRVSVPKGEYTLWARKGADGGWELLLNSKTGREGRRYDAATDVAAVPLHQDEAGEAAEVLTIGLSESGMRGELTIRWGELSLATTFKSN